MAGVLANESKQLLLDERLANPPYDNLELALFSGALVPDETTDLATYEADEIADTGYARETITGWSPAILLGSGHAYSAANLCTFTNSGGSPWTAVTGWFWVDVANNVAVMGGRFSASFVLGAGQSYSTSPFDLLTGE